MHDGKFLYYTYNCTAWSAVRNRSLLLWNLSEWTATFISGLRDWDAYRWISRSRSAEISKCLHYLSLTMTGIRRSSIYTMINTSIQSWNASYTNVWKVAIILQASLQWQDNSIWPYFLLNDVCSMSSHFILIWWRPVFKPIWKMFSRSQFGQPSHQLSDLKQWFFLWLS